MIAHRYLPNIPAQVTDVKLEVLSSQISIAVETLPTFAAVSDPKRKRFFCAKISRKAFSGVTARDVQFRLFLMTKRVACRN